MRLLLIAARHWSRTREPPCSKQMIGLYRHQLTALCISEMQLFESYPLTFANRNRRQAHMIAFVI